MRRLSSWTNRMSIFSRLSEVRRSKKSSEFVAIDEQSNHEIVHAFRLREAQRPTY